MADDNPILEDESLMTVMSLGSAESSFWCPQGKNYRQQYSDVFTPKPPGAPEAETNSFLKRMDERRAKARAGLMAENPAPDQYSSDLVPVYHINTMLQTCAYEGAGAVSAEDPVEVDIGETTPVVQATDPNDPASWPRPTYNFRVEGFTGTVKEVYSVDWPYSVQLVDKEFLNGVLQTISAPYEET